MEKVQLVPRTIIRARVTRFHLHDRRVGAVGVAIDHLRLARRLGGALSEAGPHLHHNTQRVREYHARDRIFADVGAILHQSSVRLLADDAVKEVEFRIGMP